MRLEQLKHIVAVNDVQSISKAAHDLYMTQPSLSVSVSSLENELGVKLFARTSKGVEATKEGQEAIRLAKHILRDLDQIKNLGKKDLIEGEIKVAIPAAICNSFSPNLIMKFNENYPNVDLILQEMTPKRIQANIGKGYHIGISATEINDYERVENSMKGTDFCCEKLDCTNMKLFVGKNTELAKEEGIELEEIKQYPIVQFDNMIDATEVFSCFMDKKIKVVHDREVLKRIIAEGKGVSILPQTFGCNDVYVREGLIKMLDIIDIDLQAVSYLLYPMEERMSPLEKTVVQSIRQLLLNKEQ